MNVHDRLRKKLVSEAIVAIQQKGLKFSHAAEIYGVAKSTLHDHISRNCSKFTKGRLCVFTEEEEKQFVRILTELKMKGYRLSPIHCRKAAYMYAELSKNKHNFNKIERMAGRKWFDGFAKRNNLRVVQRISILKKKKKPSDGISSGITVENGKQHLSDQDQARYKDETPIPDRYR